MARPQGLRGDWGADFQRVDHPGGFGGHFALSWVQAAGACLPAVLVSPARRCASELLRADDHGTGRISACRIMSLGSVLCAAGGCMPFEASPWPPMFLKACACRGIRV